MTTRTGRRWPIGGMPPIANPVRSWASRAVARRRSRPGDRGRVGRGRPGCGQPQGRERFRAVSRGDDEDQGLHDLAEFDTDGGCSLGRRMGRLVGSRDLERDPFRAAASRTRWIAGGPGRRARPESSIGPTGRNMGVASRPRSGADPRRRRRAGTHATRCRLAGLGCRNIEVVSRPMAAPDMPARSGLSIDLWVGDGRLGRCGPA